MSEKSKKVDYDDTLQNIDSRFRLVIVAGRRTKQLLQGATARVESDQSRKKNTSIAVEEVKRGLVNFSLVVGQP
jgi:DNA-directed RNA polymerase omega subunit